MMTSFFANRGDFKVVSYNKDDGYHFDSFYSPEAAEAFAKDVAKEGFHAMVLEAGEIFTAESEIEDTCATPGIDYPATLNAPLSTVSM